VCVDGIQHGTGVRVPELYATVGSAAAARKEIALEGAPGQGLDCRGMLKGQSGQQPGNNQGTIREHQAATGDEELEQCIIAVQEQAGTLADEIGAHWVALV
jgi:hypothetical protein